MAPEYWILLCGALLVLMALSATLLKKLPISTAMIYLLLGMLLSPLVFDVAHIDVFKHSIFLEHFTELVVLVSLFAAGLKMRVALLDPRWRAPLLLASATMLITISLLSVMCSLMFGVGIGVSILLAAILAPTDPVLASEVQVANADDHDRLRFSLTGEAGLNDGTSFPFVILGLTVLSGPNFSSYITNWILVDLLWATGAALLIGWVSGFLIAKLTLYLRRTYSHAVGLDEFLALGLIAISYSLALISHSYGFLATFAAAVSFRHFEMKDTGANISPDSLLVKEENTATHQKAAAAHLVAKVQSFSEQMEGVLELSIVVILGILLSQAKMNLMGVCYVILLFIFVRPVAVYLTLRGVKESVRTIPYLGWFGIRGVGSFYYLFYCINHGLAQDKAKFIITIVFTALTLSIFMHGISATPLMKSYNAARNKVRRKGRAEKKQS